MLKKETEEKGNDKKIYPKESNLPKLGNTFVWYAVALIALAIIKSFDTTFTSNIIGLAVSLLLTLNILNVFYLMRKKIRI